MLAAADPTTNPANTPQGMSDSLKIALTALLGIVAFIAGQIIQRLFIEPIQEQRRIKGRVANALTAYQNAWIFQTSYDSNLEAKKRLDDASMALHGLAADLRASRYVLPIYKVFALMRLVLPEKTVMELADELLHWGGMTGGGQGSKARRDKIMSLLDINFGEVASEGKRTEGVKNAPAETR
jgi:hypothetical protein